MKPKRQLVRPDAAGHGSKRWANNVRALVLSSVHFSVIVALVGVAALIPIFRHGG